MKLRKQLFAAFLAVSILPLLVVSLYLFGTNAALAHSLYQDEVLNSTQIQTDLVEEHLNRMMVRAGNFAANRSVRNFCANSNVSGLPSMDIAVSDEILKFTDETLDSVSVFALLAKDGSILYSSGSNSDTQQLSLEAQSITWETRQTVVEMFIDAENRSLAIVTPVTQDNVRVGGVLVVYRSDYFLKTISSHKQAALSNAFIYCNNHQAAILARRDIPQKPDLPLHSIENKTQGFFSTKINGQLSMCYFSAISKTPWLLVSTLPYSAMIPILLQYGVVSIFVLLLCFGVIFWLSRRQSRRVLRPLDHLLGAVEQFFLSEAQTLPALDIDPKTEIGYLAGKFSGMTLEIVDAQKQLRESTYLYQTLLNATYEIRLTIFVQDNLVTCFPDRLEEQLNVLESASACDRVMQFLQSGMGDGAPPQVLRGIVFGHTKEPADTQVCCNMGPGRERCWFRMLSVPIADAMGNVNRVVLHFEDITEKKKEEQRLIRSSQRDPLCGLLNKTAFLPRCYETVKGFSNAVFFIDLDQFKQVNDALGHATGDEVLVKAADIIRSQFRTSDVLGRYGGDEFVVFAPFMTHNQAEERARILVKQLNFKLDTLEKQCLYVTASVGVCITGQTLDLPHCVTVADAAMYHAKQHGKCQFYIVENAPELPSPS